MIRRRARARPLALAIALLAAASIATAQEPRERREADPTEGPDDDASRPGPPDVPRRTPPDYDGRSDPGMDAIDVLLWIPRVIFWPVHAFFEYLLRRPIGWILTTGERERWDALQLQPSSRTGPSWGLVPAVYFDLGFQPAVGAYVWLDDAIARGDDLRVHVGFSGLGWLRGVVLDRVALSDSSDLALRFDASARPDYLFVGIGGDAQPDIQSRFGRRSLESAIRAEHRPWRASQLGFEAGVAAHEFYDTDYRWSADERTISDAIAQGWYPNLSTLPPGFEGYTAYSQRLEGAFDTRESRPSDGSGVRVEAHAELGVDLFRAVDRRWLLWGGEAGAYWDIDAGRTLGLWASADLATPLGREAVPFTELPDLGVRGRMEGFRRGWLIGESVAAAVLEYRYPIWVVLEGFVDVAIGNAFGANLEGIDPERLRTSYVVGLRTVGDPDQSFTVQVGFGTATVEDGLDPAILRVTAGMQEGL